MENPAIKNYTQYSEEEAITKILENDDIMALRYLADNDYITTANYDKTYLLPAVKLKAFKCLNYLKEWENYNY